MPTSSKNLWASALENLAQSDRQQLDYDGQDRLDILSNLQVLTERAKEQCIKKRWRLQIPGRNGETVVLRDIFTKMVVWIDTFKKIGDTVVQYDPGHAALPWAGVRFILQIVVGDIVKFGFVVEGAESIARMIGRYAIFEDIYLRSASAASMELENALVRLYSTILMYQSKAKHFFEQSSAKRIIRSVFVTEDELGSLAKKMDVEQVNVDRCAATLTTENQASISDSLGALSISQYENYARLKDLLQSIDGPVLRMSSQLNDIEDNLDQSKRYEILRWLSAQPHQEHHEQIGKKALAGTGRWLLEDSIYAEWHKRSSSSLLWLHGKVGAGKSTLVSIVIEDAMKRSSDGRGPPPVYFYCSRNAAESQRSDAAAIFSSIVRQLSCTEPGLPLLPPVVEIYEKKGRGFDSHGLRIEDSCEIIKKLIEYYPMTTIVIDALDECNAEEREMLLDAIEGLLQDSSLGLLKVFLSSRDDQDITCTLREYPNVDLVSSRNSADIEAFVRDETNRLVRKQRLLRHSNAKEELVTLVVDKVSRGADGMFRWASLQLEMLCSMKLDQDIRARLGRIPPKLEQLYEEIYKNNLLKYPGEVGQSIISNIMKWLLCAQRQMRSSELCTAVVLNTVPAEELTKEHVLDLCHNFVVFDDSLDVFRFAHLSVREFLEKQAEYMANACHLLVAETCLLQFVGLSEWSAAKALLQDHYSVDLRGKAASTAELLGGFHSYATKFWARHCQLIGEEGRTKNPRFKRIFRLFLSGASDDLSPLGIWLQSDRRGIQDGYLQNEIGPSSGCKPEDRVYFVACAYAFYEIIRVCMHEDPPKDWKKGCSLAIRNSEVKALKVLLDNRTEDEISMDLVREVAFDMDFDTLDWVLRKGKINVIELLHKTINMDTWGGYKNAVEGSIARYELGEVSPPLVEYAAKFCSASTFESLMRQNKDCENSWDWDWDLLIELAAQQGNWEVLILLLGKKNFQTTPHIMQAIAKSGEENLMRMLLDRDDAGEITSDVISAGAGNCDEKILTLLIHRAPSARIIISKKAVHSAIRNRNAKVLGLLLDKGYPISQALVNEAACYGWISTLQLLLDRGGLITGLVLRCAVTNSCDVMNLLLAEVNDRSIMEEMMEMMKIATSYPRRLSVMRLLLEWAGNILITEDVLATAAIRDREGDLIKLLSARDWEMTEEALEVIMERQKSEEALQLVLDRLEDSKVTRKVLLAAARNISFGDQLVRRLLDRANFLDVVDQLLVEAAGNKNLGLEIVLLLQRRFSNINVTQEAIERAASTGSVRTMTFFLEYTSAPITEAIAIRALMRDRSEMVRFVLDRATGLPITREMVRAAARCSDTISLTFIWERACTAGMTENVSSDFAQVAMENMKPSQENFEVFLHNVKNLVITPEALINIARANDDSAFLLDLLIDHGAILRITLELVQAAASNASLTTFLLERSDGIELTDDIFRATAGNGNEEVLQVLSEYCGLAKVSEKWLDIVRLHDTLEFITRSISMDPQLDLVEDLIGRRVEPDVPDRAGWTPLFRAINSGGILTVQALLSAGANPNSMDSQGRTPLFYAALRGHFAIVEILLDLGVPTHLEDEDGETPALAAKSYGHLRVFRLLERRRQP